MPRMVRGGLIQATLCESATAPVEKIKRAMIEKHETLIAQAGLLAYMDVFLYCALLAFAFVQFTFLLSPVKKAGGAPGH